MWLYVGTSNLEDGKQVDWILVGMGVVYSVSNIKLEKKSFSCTDNKTNTATSLPPDFRMPTQRF